MRYWSRSPGVRKLTIARALTQSVGGIWLRIDSIEQALRESGTLKDSVDDAGYLAAYSLAEDNLKLGGVVINDSVNGWACVRDAWRDVGLRAQARVLEVEVVCSDILEHRRRVETRTSEIAGLCLPDWAAVTRREYHVWTWTPLVVDTAARSVDACVAVIRSAM